MYIITAESDVTMIIITFTRVLFSVTRKMQNSGATDLASKGRGGVLDGTISATKLKEEIEDVHPMEKVRCPCGNSLQADSMIKVSTFFFFSFFYLISQFFYIFHMI